MTLTCEYTTSGKVWSSWNDATTTTTATTTATSSTAIWQSWVYPTTTSIWQTWVYPTGTTTTTTSYIWPQWVNAQEETKEQRQARAETERVHLEEMARRDAQRKAEAAKALELLKEHLSEKQKADLKTNQSFEVVGGSGKRYVIEKGHAGNVYSLDEHRRKIAKHCIHPVDDVPDYDVMLSQMLWLKWNEELFHKTANTTRLVA